MPFCNQNGIQGLYCPFPTSKPIIPFWLQKGMKNAKFCINKFISWKYASRAFKIRSWNVYTTSGYDFMPIYMFIKKGKKIGGGPKKKTSKILIYAAIVKGFWKHQKKWNGWTSKWSTEKSRRRIKIPWVVWVPPWLDL